MTRPDRHWWTTLGPRSATRARVLPLLDGLDDILWVGETDVDVPACLPGALRHQLGSDRAIVVLDLSDGVDADLVGIAHGLVRAGGTLVLRVDPEAPGSEKLALHPFARKDVSVRLRDRLLAELPPNAPSFAPAPRTTAGTPEQARVVDQLVERLQGPPGTATVLLAPRGRGKSAALGLALAQLDGPVALTAIDPRATDEVQRFADVPFVRLDDVPPDSRVVVVDEAARVPLGLLKALVQRCPAARFVFATTTDGYEGTGKGFVVRFTRWLDATRPTLHLQLSAPIRWSADDPLEARVDRLFLFDVPLRPLAVDGPFEHRLLDRALLATNEDLLREVVGLLAHAHYRTTPSDLHRLLDAPNLAVHAMLAGERVGAVCLVAREGGLPADVCDALTNGRMRIRGHALADTLVCHAGRPDAGERPMLRSVRLATHPDARRRGLASQLVQAVHEAYDVSLFGTLFAGNPDVVRFRRQLGYAVVRVGSSVSPRSGAPSIVMVRSGRPADDQLVGQLTRAFSRDWPVQRALLVAEGGVDPELLEAIDEDLAPPAPLDRTTQEAMLRGYVRGGRTYEAASPAIEALVDGRRDLDPVLVARAVDRRPWRELAAGSSPRAVMRHVRRCIETLLQTTK